MYTLPRTELLATFAQQLPADAIEFEAEMRAIEPGAPGQPARAETVDGRTYEADLVVAADGGRSAARQLLLPEHPGPADGGYTLWWMLAPGLDKDEEVIANETMGKGAVWGTWPLPDGRFTRTPPCLSRPGLRRPGRGSVASLMIR